MARHGGEQNGRTALWVDSEDLALPEVDDKKPALRVESHAEKRVGRAGGTQCPQQATVRIEDEHLPWPGRIDRIEAARIDVAVPIRRDSFWMRRALRQRREPLDIAAVPCRRLERPQRK